MPGRTISVKSTIELNKAIKSAVGGDTIVLASGKYSGDVIVNSINPRSLVTVKSADPSAEAVIDGLIISRSSNFSFEDLEVSHILQPGETESNRAVRVQFSKDITLVGLNIHGSLNHNPHDDGIGFSSINSQRIALLDSSFKELNIGALFAVTDDVIFAGNTIDRTREGINLAQVNGGLVERNYFANIVPDAAKADHADAIQVHAGGTYTSSSDLVFRGNVMKLGTSGTHGIFIRNEKGLQGLTHKNILIDDNYYEGNARHGISLNYAEKVTITDNTVRDIGSGGLVPAINLQNVRGAMVDDNIAPLLLGAERSAGNSSVVWVDNIDVWDRLRGIGVSESSLFSSQVGSTSLDFAGLNVRSGTMAAAKGIGFAALDNIGDLKAASAAILAAYVPQFDVHHAHAVML